MKQERYVGQQPNTRGTTVPAVANYLGISEPTVFKAIKSGALRAKKIGKRTVILPLWVDTYLDGRPDVYPDLSKAS